MNRTIDFDTVRSIGLEMPGVEETTAYGSRTLRVRGKLLAGIPVNGSAESGPLMVRVDIRDREHLLAKAPDVYYVTDYYVGHPAVLVMLSRVTPEVLHDLLRMAHKYLSRKTQSRTTKRKRRGKVAP